MISVSHAVPRSDVFLGLVRAEGILAGHYSPGFENQLEAVLQARRGELSSDEEARRTAARDVLRNGTYKPTGRGKPANEYLLRAASEGAFPRINAPVDACNLLSLKYIVPISIWDLALSEADQFVFRLGQSGEQYVFNEGGQVIDLKDLLVGCRVRGEGDPTGNPIVNPIKDSLGTKTTRETTHVAACIYAPAGAVSLPQLERICAEFGELLAGCGEAVQTSYAVLERDSSIVL